MSVSTWAPPGLQHLQMPKPLPVGLNKPAREVPDERCRILARAVIVVPGSEITQAVQVIVQQFAVVPR